MLFWGEYLVNYLRLALANDPLEDLPKREIADSLRLKLKLADSINSLMESQYSVLSGLGDTISSGDPIVFSRAMRSVKAQAFGEAGEYLFCYGVSFMERNIAMARIVSKMVKGGMQCLPNAVFRQAFFRVKLITYTQIELEVSLPGSRKATRVDQAYKEYLNLPDMDDMDFDYEFEDSNDKMLESQIETRVYGNENLTGIRELVRPLRISMEATGKALDLLKSAITSRYSLKDYFSYE